MSSTQDQMMADEIDFGNFLSTNILSEDWSSATLNTYAPANDPLVFTDGRSDGTNEHLLKYLETAEQGLAYEDDSSTTIRHDDSFPINGINLQDFASDFNHLLPTAFQALGQSQQHNAMSLPNTLTIPLDATADGDTTTTKPAEPRPIAEEGELSPYQRRHNTQPFIKNGYTCETCHRAFNRMCDLRKHAKKHMPYHARPFQCTTCVQKFITMKDRDRHIRTHQKLAQQVGYMAALDTVDEPRNEVTSAVAPALHEGNGNGPRDGDCVSPLPSQSETNSGLKRKHTEDEMEFETITKVPKLHDDRQSKTQDESCASCLPPEPEPDSGLEPGHTNNEVEVEVVKKAPNLNNGRQSKAQDENHASSLPYLPQLKSGLKRKHLDYRVEVDGVTKAANPYDFRHSKTHYEPFASLCRSRAEDGPSNANFVDMIDERYRSSTIENGVVPEKIIPLIEDFLKPQDLMSFEEASWLGLTETNIGASNPAASAKSHRFIQFLTAAVPPPQQHRPLSRTVPDPYASNPSNGTFEIIDLTDTLRLKRRKLPLDPTGDGSVCSTIAATRQMSACIRCRMQRLRVSFDAMFNTGGYALSKT